MMTKGNIPKRLTGYIMNNEKNGQLYICATPIGNLEDITLMVLRILKEVDFIAAEDTRHTLKLLNYYDIKTPITSYHEHNKLKKGKELLDKLMAGASIALVSDSGMPGISDPGRDIISLCHSMHIAVSVCPGASAGISALVISGFCSRRYAFEGFLPSQKKFRKAALESLAYETRTIILYESPHRLLTTLNELYQSLGDREIAIARELTKKFEEISFGQLSELLKHYEENLPKGEFVLIIKGAAQVKGIESLHQSFDGDVIAHVKHYVGMGSSEMDAMKKVAKDRGLSKGEVYRLYKIKN